MTKVRTIICSDIRIGDTVKSAAMRSPMTVARIVESSTGNTVELGDADGNWTGRIGKGSKVKLYDRIEDDNQEGDTMEAITTGITYTDDDGVAYRDESLATIVRIEGELLNGRYFALHSMSAGSTFGYQPPVSRRSWGHVMTTLGAMACESDALAQVARAIVGKVPLYGTDSDIARKVYDGAVEAIRDGFDDVIGRSAPDAGRYQDHQRPFNIHEVVALAYWLAEATAKVSSSVPGVGWCVSAIARAHHVRLPDCPSLPHDSRDARSNTNRTTEGVGAM